MVIWSILKHWPLITLGLLVLLGCANVTKKECVIVENKDEFTFEKDIEAVDYLMYSVTVLFRPMVHIFLEGRVNYLWGIHIKMTVPFAC